jgi:hypothetical protein
VGYFHRWCNLRAVPRLPASPANVAIFVAESGLPPEILHAELEAIDREHEALDYSPPSKASVVIAAFNHEHPVEPPRSWRSENKQMFLALPHALQIYWANHEDKREKEIRRAHTELDQMRQNLKKMENENNKTAA